MQQDGNQDVPEIESLFDARTPLPPRDDEPLEQQVSDLALGEEFNIGVHGCRQMSELDHAGFPCRRSVTVPGMSKKSTAASLIIGCPLKHLFVARCGSKRIKWHCSSRAFRQPIGKFAQQKHELPRILSIFGKPVKVARVQSVSTNGATMETLGEGSKQGLGSLKQFWFALR